MIMMACCVPSWNVKYQRQELLFEITGRIFHALMVNRNPDDDPWRSFVRSFFVATIKGEELSVSTRMSQNILPFMMFTK